MKNEPYVVAEYGTRDGMCIHVYTHVYTHVYVSV